MSFQKSAGMPVLVTGGAGQLGIELIRQAPAHAIEVMAPGRAELDVTRLEQVQAAIAAHRPALVVNAAAYTQVDRAESEPESAEAVNTAAPAHLARTCAEAGIPLVHVSTDYVFDGRKRTPYVEDDPVAPLGVYGRSKAGGEAAVRRLLPRHLIIRTAWLYSAHRSNFLKTIMRLAAERDELRVVDDQIGAPTSAADLADAILRIIGRLHASKTPPWGTYHYCGAGRTSWFGFARRILEVSGSAGGTALPRLVPITTAEYPTPARRPMFSVLDCRRLAAGFGIEPRPWQLGTDETVLGLLSAPPPG